MRACDISVIKAPKCTKAGEYAVKVEYADKECVIAARSTSEVSEIIDSLHMRVVTKMRYNEDIKHRSSGLENWVQQCIKNNCGVREPMIAGKNVQGLHVPFFVFDCDGGERFIVWFNLWPCAWIAGGDMVYERCDNMKDLFASIKRRYKVAGEQPAASALISQLPNGSRLVTAVEHQPPPMLVGRSLDLSYGGMATEPIKTMQPSAVTVRCYDGVRVVSEELLMRMKCGDTIADFSHDAFDIVHDILRGRVRGLKISYEAVLFITHYGVVLPPNVGKLCKVARDTLPGAVDAPECNDVYVSAIEIDGMIVKIIPHREV